MFTILVLARKGGAGKTTACINIAGVLSKDGTKNVGIHDIDQQGSLASWFNRRVKNTGENKAPYYVKLDHTNLQQSISKAEKAGFDYLVIDTKPEAAENFLDLINVADLVVISTKASTSDLEAITDSIKAVRAAGKPFTFNISETPRNSVDLVDAMRFLSNFGPIMTVTRPVQAFRRMFTQGETIHEHAPDSKATMDVNDIKTFIETFEEHKS